MTACSIECGKSKDACPLRKARPLVARVEKRIAVFTRISARLQEKAWEKERLGIRGDTAKAIGLVLSARFTECPYV